MDKRLRLVNWGPGRERHRTSQTNWREPLKWNRAGDRQRVFCASLADWLDNEVPIEWVCDLFELVGSTPNLDWLMLTKRIATWRDRLELAADAGSVMAADWLAGAAPHNVWLGTSAEDQRRWDERVAHLVSLPAVVHFVSAEPLLGPIDMGSLSPSWVIVGGESGPRSRAMDPEWVRSLRDQCSTNGSAFFFKQWGGTNKRQAGRTLDGKTFDELPSLQVH